jgi:hypothetical protein
MSESENEKKELEKFMEETFLNMVLSKPTGINKRIVHLLLKKDNQDYLEMFQFLSTAKGNIKWYKKRSFQEYVVFGISCIFLLWYIFNNF